MCGLGHISLFGYIGFEILKVLKLLKITFKNVFYQ